MGFTMVPVEHHLRIQSHSVVLESPPCCPVIVISMHIAFDLVPLMSQAATTSRIINNNEESSSWSPICDDDLSERPNQYLKEPRKSCDACKEKQNRA